jgi:hypothetical protein
MGDLLTMALLVGGYVVLMRYVLPRLGVPTCMAPGASRRCWAGGGEGEDGPAAEADGERRGARS